MYFQNIPPFPRLACFCVAISGDFECSHYFHFQKDFLEEKWITALSVESAKIENASFPYKTVKSEAKMNLSQRTEPCQ